MTLDFWWKPWSAFDCSVVVSHVGEALLIYSERDTRVWRISAFQSSPQITLLTGDADSIFLHSFYNFVYYLISWPNKSLVQTVLTALGQNLKVCILLLTYLSFVDELWQSQHSIETQLFIHPNYPHKKQNKTNTQVRTTEGEKGNNGNLLHNISSFTDGHFYFSSFRFGENRAFNGCLLRKRASGFFSSLM